MITYSADKFPSDLVSCLFECLFSAFLNACMLHFDVIMTKNELCPLMYFPRCFRRLGTPLFPFLDHQGHCRIYIKYSTWHHIFIILATVLDPKKFYRNYVEAGTKCPKYPKLSSRAKNGCTQEKNISAVTGLFTLTFGWKISKGVISRTVKDFAKFLPLDKLLLSKNIPN